MAKEKSNLVNLTSNLTSFDYSDVGDYNKNGTPHPIADVEAQYDKLDVDEGQLIKRDIGERYIGSNVDAGFVRGGIATKVQRQVEDQERIGKFLTTPKGALFVLKQGILQNQNADRETNIYNPLSLNTSLIDTLPTRPQRHINEVTSPFSSLGNFFRFLSGTNTSEQGRKNGNSISNNRNVNNLKPDVDTFGGKVKIPRTIPEENFGIEIKTDNEIDVSGPNENRKSESYIPFKKSTDSFNRLPNTDIKIGSRKESDSEFPDKPTNLDIQEEKGVSSQEERNMLFEMENNELIGDNTTSNTFSRRGPRFKNESTANKFFDIKSKGSRKLQVNYGGALGDPSVAFTNEARIGAPGRRSFEDSYKLPKDFIKFRIRDVINGRWIIFPAIFTAGITDNSQASYNPINYIGRADAVHIYQNRTRSISFGFRVVALNEEDIPVIWEKMNYLKGLTLPQYKSFFSDTSTSNNTRPVAPIINLTIGDMFVNTPGYFTSVSINVANSSTWETKEGRQFPHVCDVSVEFTYIGKEVPSMLGKHYDGAERVPTTAEREALNAGAKKRKQDNLAKAKRRRKENDDAFKKGLDFSAENIKTFGTGFSNQFPGRKPLLNVVPDSLGTTTQPTQPLSEHTINIGSLNATGQQSQQGSGAYKSALFVDKVKPLSKFEDLSLTKEQQKVKSDVMKATGGTGIL